MQDKTTLIANLSAKKIQTNTRRFFAQKKYGIKQISVANREDYKVFIRGNDPQITLQPHSQPDEHIALVATSGMRSIELACQLDTNRIKLIILDNSKQVIAFWQKAKEILSFADTKEIFLIHLYDYISTTNCDKGSSRERNMQYLEDLFKKYGFDKIKMIINSSSVIAQSWSDTDIINKIKNILKYQNINAIYAYPSNIVAYLYNKLEINNSKMVLENIALLNPIAAIHTDMQGLYPANVIITDNHSPNFMLSRLNLQMGIANEISLEYQLFSKIAILSTLLSIIECEIENSDQKGCRFIPR